MKRSNTITSAVIILGLLAAVPINVHAQNQVNLNITTQDHYTGIELDSVAIALYFDGVLLDSTVTTADGKALLRITVTSLESPKEVPAEFQLSANYPNPFNTDTRVDLAVPESQPVRLDIYNVIGQRVASQSVLLDAGRYSLNLSMGHLPVGVYFLRVAGRDAKVEKMVKLGRGVGSPGVMFRMEPQGGQVTSRPVIDRKSGLGTTLSSDEGYLLRATRNRYRNFETQPEIQGDTDLLVALRRENRVSITTVNQDEQPVARTVQISGEQFAAMVTTPDTLVLDSGIFTVKAADAPEPGSTADFLIDGLIEIISRDSAYTVTPFIPQEAEVSGRVANDQEELVSGAMVQVYRQGALYASATTNMAGEFSTMLLADGSLYSLVIYPANTLNGVFVPGEFYSFSPDAQVLTPLPGGSYNLEFLLYTESPLTIPGGDISLPAGPYTLANDGATVSVANIPPDLGIVGGSARVYSPNITPDAFPGEFATRQSGFESGLISGGFASVNLLRSDGNGGVEPISELRDSTGAPVQVLLRFLMDPLDYDVLREPASLSHLPGYVNRPDTIGVPLYYYDESSGDWLLSPEFGWLENERGVIPPSELNRIREGEYEEPVYVAGRVDHFTWYNLDYPEERACLTGRIVDQNNNAVKKGKLTFRSMPEQAGRSFYSNTANIHTNEQGYFRYAGPRSERNSGDDWNENNRIDTFHAQAEYADKNACSIAIFDNNGSGFRMPQFPERDGCGNIGTIRVSLKQAKKEKFSITFTDIERDGQPGRPLFVDPRSVRGQNYAYATLTDLRIPLLGDIWNCACDNGTTTPDCNRLSTISGSGKASFEIPVLQRDSNDPVQLDERLTGIFSYRKMRPDLGEGAYEFAECAYLTKTKPPKDGDDPIVIECEVEERGQPVIEIVRIEGDTPGLRDFLYDEVVTLEATGRTNRGISIDEFDNFYWTNDLETLFIGSRRIFTRPANQLFGTGNGLSIRAHGIDLFGFKGDALETGISVADVSIVVFANRTVMVPGDTVLAVAQITGANNTGVRWQSLTPAIAQVNSQGEVTGLQPGTAVIRGQSLADQSKTATVEIQIINLVADFTVDPTAGDSLTQFTFDATTSLGEISEYSWVFGDGNSSSGEIVNHIYGASGLFSVTLTVTGEFGLQSTKTRIVSTTGQPLAVINADPLTGIVPLTVVFDGSSSVSPVGTIQSWIWDFGDGNSSSGDATSHTYTQAGTYTAKLEVTDTTGLTAEDSVAIRVVTPLVASFTVSPLSGEPPLEVTVDASASAAPEGSIIRYSWDFGDGTVIADGNVTEVHQYNVEGLFEIVLVIESDAGVTAETTQLVEVGCETFEGNISITSADQMQQLLSICRVNGNVTISQSGTIASLTGFNNLIEISGNLTINNNGSLQLINGFDNLRSVRNLTVNNNVLLQSINGFRNLISARNILIRNNEVLSSSSGFSRLTEAREIEFNANINLTELPEFEALAEITNSLVLFNLGIVSFNGFNNLKHVRDQFGFGTNSNLVSIAGFNELESVREFYIINNPSLQEISSFNNLEQVSSIFEIANNPGISVLNAFQKLERVNSRFTFTDTNVSACEILDISQRILASGAAPSTVQIQNHPDMIANITVGTQQQMEDFAGTCMVTGTLNITTSLSSISGFESLKFVSVLNANNSPNITSLGSFDNLVQVSTLNILGNNSLSSLAGLNKLSIISNITIKENHSLVSLDGLESINKIGSLNIDDNQNLADFSALSLIEAVNIELRKLPSVSTLTGLESVRRLGSITMDEMPSLSSIDALSGLNHFESALSILGTGIEQLPQFQIEQPHNASLRIRIERNPNLVDLTGLEFTTHLSLLSLIDNASLSSITGLNNVTIVAADGITIRDNPLLTSMSGLDNLESLGLSSFTISNNGLTSLDGLENLTTLNILQVEDSPLLLNINALGNLTRASRISITNSGLTDLNGLINLEGDLQNLTLLNLSNLTNISGLSGVTRVRTGITINGNPQLLNLNGLQNISQIGFFGDGVLNILNNAGLQNLDGLTGLTELGDLTIQNNPNLLNLNALSNLETLQRFTVNSNEALVRVSGMSSLNRVNNLFTVTNNAQLPSCDVDILIAQLQAANGIGGVITTSGNDPDGVCGP